MSANPPSYGPPGSFPPPPPPPPPPPGGPYGQQPGQYDQPNQYSQPAYGAAPPPPAKKTWLLWVAGGCGCLVLLAAIFAATLFFGVKAGTAGAETVVKSFLDSAGKGRYVEAYDYFSAPLKATQSLETFRTTASENSHLFQVKDTTFTERSVDLTSAKLAGSLTLESGTDIPAKFDLVKENDAWRILNYSIGSND